MLILSNRVLEVKKKELDMEYSYMLLFVKNTLSKLMKYQEFLPQSSVYATAIIMNPIFCWKWMKKKTSYLFKNAQVTVLDLWKYDYNSKVFPKPNIGILIARAKE